MSTENGNLEIRSLNEGLLNEGEGLLNEGFLKEERKLYQMIPS